MYVLITYDIATSDTDGEQRLRRVAKACEDFGQRVQYSVFECKVDPAQYVQLKALLTRLISADHDSIRFYLLGNNWKKRIEHVGRTRGYDIEGPLIVDE